MKTKCQTHKCHACCCYNIPFDSGELERFKDRIVRPVLFTENLFGALVAFTDPNPEYNKCPFLRDDYKCNIYENRPDLCRLYGMIDKLPCQWLKK